MKPRVLTAQPGSYLTFIHEDGLDDAYDLSKPMQVVPKADYDRLASVAKRVALRAGFTAEALKDLLALVEYG